MLRCLIVDGTRNWPQNSIDHLLTCIRLLTPHFPLQAKRFNFIYYILFNLINIYQQIYLFRFFSTPREKTKIDVTTDEQTQVLRFKVCDLVKKNFER